MKIRKYREKDIPAMISIWNKVVEDGEAFPQEDFLNDITGADFFAAQTYCGVADNNGKIVGLYILHPNNIGRCGHIANASYAVDTDYRGEHIGEKLVDDCLVQAKQYDFGILQFMLWWKTIFMPAICMNGWVLYRLELYRKVSV